MRSQVDVQPGQTWDYGRRYQTTLARVSTEVGRIGRKTARDIVGAPGFEPGTSCSQSVRSVVRVHPGPCQFQPVADSLISPAALLFVIV